MPTDPRLVLSKRWSSTSFQYRFWKSSRDQFRLSAWILSRSANSYWGVISIVQTLLRLDKPDYNKKKTDDASTGKLTL